MNTESKINSLWEKVKENYCYPLREIVFGYAESPIEQTLFLALLDNFCCFSIDSRDDCGGFKDYISTSQGRYGIWHLEPQVTIDKYRVDFRILFPKNPKLKIIIECDGHNFHEKTKEQAIRDKKRDRNLTKLGFKILRFSGSEIYNNVEDCVKEIFSLVDQSLEE